VALFKLTKAFANAHIKKNYQDLRLFLSDNQSDANFYILWILRLAPNYIPRSEITDFIKNVIDYISIDGAYFDALVFKIIKEYGLAKIDVQDTLNRLTEKSKSELTIAVRNLIIDELNNPKDTIQSDISLRNWLRMRKKHCLKTELASTIIFGKICDFVYNNIESRELKGKTLSLANLRIRLRKHVNKIIKVLAMPMLTPKPIVT